MLSLALSFFVLAEPPPLTAEQQRRVTPAVEVVRQNADAVVAIQATHVVTAQQSIFDVFLQIDPGKSVRGSIGSGSIIHPDGYVLTNAHVVAQASELSVALPDGRSLPAHMVAALPEDDVAIVKIDGASGLPTVQLGRSADAMVGEQVIAIGAPAGLQSTVTTGVLSALDREVAPSARVRIKGLLQTDAAINPGSSGGPLFNVLGEQIGVNTAIRSDAQNVGFAIPIDRVRGLLPRLFNVEARGRAQLGLTLTREGETGIPIDDVRRGSPAHKAGIERGMVLRRVAGREVHTLIDALVAFVEQTPGVPFEVRAALPEGAVDVFTVVMEALPPPDGRALAESVLGLNVTDIDPATAARLGLRSGAGVVVKSVRGGSSAARVGVAPGDLLTRVGPYGLRRVSDLSVLEGARPGMEIAVRVVRITNGRVLQAEVLITAP